MLNEQEFHPLKNFDLNIDTVDLTENLNIETPEIEDGRTNIDESQSNTLSTGRWTQEEHNKFLEGILLYGNEWKQVSQHIKTRSSTQARSHSQKFLIPIKKKLTEKLANHLSPGEAGANPTSRIKEFIMTWINENISSELKGEAFKDKAEKLCKIMAKLILNPTKRSTNNTHKLTPSRNCCGSNTARAKNYKDCKQVCCLDKKDFDILITDNTDDTGMLKGEGSLKPDLNVINIVSFNLSEKSNKEESDIKSDPFNLGLFGYENVKEYSEGDNFDYELYFGDN
jgi:SHAQKYF class myb-like DNA-binding protein